MNKKYLMGIALTSVLALTACSNDTYRKNYDAEMQQQIMYRQAYEELQALKSKGQTQTYTPTTSTTQRPATTTTNTPAVNTYNDRQEVLTVVGSGTIMSYNVVCGSFSVKDNALKLQQTLNNNGYSSVIALNEKGMYRVIAATFNDRESAVTTRDKLRSTYPDAWLLFKQ